MKLEIYIYIYIIYTTLIKQSVCMFLSSIFKLHVYVISTCIDEFYHDVYVQKCVTQTYLYGLDIV